MAIQRDPKKSNLQAQATRSTDPAGAQSRRGQQRSQLAGLSYSEQLAAVKPGAGGTGLPSVVSIHPAPSIWISGVNPWPASTNQAFIVALRPA